MDFEPLIEARKTLNPLWEFADLKGRCWGPKRKDNPYAFSNITLAIGNELITISMDGNKHLIIHEFRKTEGTALGERVKDILKEQGLPFR
jgi:hypothetical protein